MLAALMVKEQEHPAEEWGETDQRMRKIRMKKVTLSVWQAVFAFANRSPVCDMGKICQAWQVLAVGCTLSLFDTCAEETCGLWMQD